MGNGDAVRGHPGDARGTLPGPREPLMRRSPFAAPAGVGSVGWPALVTACTQADEGSLFMRNTARAVLAALSILGAALSSGVSAGSAGAAGGTICQTLKGNA